MAQRDSQGNTMGKKPSIFSMHNAMTAGKSKPKGNQSSSSTSAGEPGEGHSMSIHDHNDGTFHTVKDGVETPHPHIGHMLMHIAHTHEPGSHMHTMHHGGEMTTTHHVHADGNVQGPHDHDNLEALRDHMDKFLGEEEMEGTGGHGQEEGDQDAPEMSDGSMY